MKTYKYTIQTPEEILTDLILSTKLNSSNTLTKFTKNSVARGILYAFAHSLAYAKGYFNSLDADKFLSTCNGVSLDNYAKEYYGVSRHTQSKSSAEVYVFAEAGTKYPAGTVFISTSGVRFLSIDEYELSPDTKCGIIKVESEDLGSTTKVYANTITTCQDAPDGHYSCTNLIPSYGGYDEESDDEFRARLYTISQRAAQETPAKIEEIVYELCPTVSRCRCYATGSGFSYLEVLKTSCADFTETELAQIKAKIQSYLGFSNSINLKVANFLKLNIDFKMKATIKADSVFNDVFNQIQAVLLAFFEPRFYNSSTIRSELVLAELTKISDIIDIPISDFSLGQDLRTPFSTLPWLHTINVTLVKTSGTQQVYDLNAPAQLISDLNVNLTNSLEEVL